MAVTRQNLTDRLNRMKNATASSPITPAEFTTFLDDWINYMTKDGAYDAGVLEAWKQQSLNQSSQVSHAPSGQITGTTVKAALEQLDALNSSLKDSMIRPSNRPSFILDFVNSKFFDPIYGFTRNSVASYVDHAGVMRMIGINKPRFTHDWVTNESIGLMYEATGANLLSNSEGYVASQATTTVKNISHSRFSGISVKKVTCTDNNDPKVIFLENIGLLGSRTLTMSIYLWTTEATPCKCYLRMYGSTSIEQLIEKKIEVTNVPTLFTLTKTFNNAVSTAINVRFDPFESDANPATGRSLYAACWQLEESDVPSSYIPTNGARVTRALEGYSMPQTRFNQFFGEVKKGCLFVNFRVASKSSLSSIVKINTSDDSKKIYIAFNAATSSVYAGIKTSTSEYVSASIPVANASSSDIMVALSFNKNGSTLVVNGISTVFATPEIPDVTNVVFPSLLLISIKSVSYYPDEMTLSMLKLLTTKQVAGNGQMNMSPTNGDLARGAYIRPESILRTLGKQEFTVDGAGATSVSRNIRRPYDCLFEVIDSDGCTITATPAGTITANTNNPLTFTAAVGKSLTYSLTPVFES